MLPDDPKDTCKGDKLYVQCTYIYVYHVSYYPLINDVQFHCVLHYMYKEPLLPNHHGLLLYMYSRKTRDAHRGWEKRFLVPEARAIFCSVIMKLTQQVQLHR